MARYVRLLRSIWSDPDFLALDAADQRLFMLIISQADMSSAGVVGRMERRWARLARDTTVDEIERSLVRLAADGFVVIDEMTDEVWVRSYIHHDELWKVPNGVKSVVQAIGAVLSPDLRARATEALERCAGPASDNPSGKGSAKGSAKGSDTPAAIALTSTHTQQQQPEGLHEPTSHSLGQPAPLPAAAEEALEIYLAHRLGSGEKITNPARWLARVRPQAREEHREALEACDPDDDPRSIAQRVFKLTTNQAWIASTQVRAASA